MRGSVSVCQVVTLLDLVANILYSTWYIVELNMVCAYVFSTVPASRKATRTKKNTEYMCYI